MAEQVILIDTSILIEHFRKTDKSNTTLISLVRQGYTYSISAVTDFEIYTGAKPEQLAFWESLLHKIKVLPFDKSVAQTAVHINNELKKHSRQIAIPDLFIAATAIEHGLSLATLNKKHFERIDKLSLIE